jgi:hypothetical protein
MKKMNIKNDKNTNETKLKCPALKTAGPRKPGESCPDVVTVKKVIPLLKKEGSSADTKGGTGRGIEET